MNKKADKILEVPVTVIETISQYLEKADIGEEFKTNQKITEREIFTLFGVITTPASLASKFRGLETNLRRPV